MRLSMTIAAALSLGLFSCVVDDEVDPDLESEASMTSQAPGSEEAESPTDDESLDSSGRVCGGMCRYNSSWGYNTCRWNVTQNCRDRIVEFCHNRGWGFIDASWSSGCWEGWVRLWPI
jgi:hypothetical protein